MPAHAEATVPSAAVRQSRGRKTAGARLLGLLFWLVVLGLIGLNAWRLWTDFSLVPMKTVNGWLASGQIEEAERALRQRLSALPHDGDARLKLARILGKREDYLGCARELHKVPYWWPAKADAAFNEAQAFKMVNHGRDAEAAWRAVIANDPLHPASPTIFSGAVQELVAFYMLESRFDEARAAIWRAYDESIPADRPNILIMRMRAELERIAHEEAVAKLRSFVAADPGDWEARRALALEEQATRHVDGATREIQAVLEARPGEASVWRTDLELLHQRGDLDGMKAALAKLPPSADSDAEIWKFRGMVHESDGDLAGASDAYRRAVDLKPYEATYLYKLGMAEQRLGKVEDARKHTKQSQALNQAYSQLRNAYLQYLQSREQSKPSAAAYQTAVERLASLCETLGWKREAAAWRGLLREE
jgi:tetratricopeptide (TPR) repeat protein